MHSVSMSVFFFKDTATTEIYALSLHDALPISAGSRGWGSAPATTCGTRVRAAPSWPLPPPSSRRRSTRSEEHTSELQSRQYLVCRLLLEKTHLNSSLADHSEADGYREEIVKAQ